MTREEFGKMTETGVVLLDGAMGTNLIKAGMPKRVCPEAWVLEHEDVAEDLQRAYVDAGSQIIYAPTFGANSHVLAGYGLKDKMAEMNRRLVALSRRAADGRALVAGDVSAVGMILEDYGGDYTPEEVFEVYADQIRVLAEEGVDLIIVETMISLNETAIALDAANSVCDLPVMCSLSVMPNGRALFDGTAREAAAVLPARGAAAVGINCCSGPEQVESIIREMKQESTVPVLAKPNAGIPSTAADGTAVYDMEPSAFAAAAARLVEAGAGLVGGCCGTTPEFIRLLGARIRNEFKLLY